MEPATHSSNSSLTARIREEARRLGFFKMGVARAGPTPHSAEFLRWLERGMQGEMHYMERQAGRRNQPGEVLENARSMLVLTMNYHSGEALSGDPLTGRISRYAWGEDYHFIVKSGLDALLIFIQSENPAARGLCYVDTGPVMEKVWGSRTSLGWMGKHTNLITREQGSWFFIGVILLDIELECAPRESDHCGTCTRCITACPTRAIVAPYVVDARMCISYLTIELRGPIPRPLRPLIGNRIYGCDDCQDVCPWNRFAVQSGNEGFRPRPENLMPALAGLVDMTPEEFERRFRKSPIRRAKRDGFVRNVCVALGNSQNPEALPALSGAMRDRSPLVRAHAAWAVGRIPGQAAIKVLHEALQAETDREVLEEIRLALSGEM